MRRSDSLNAKKYIKLLGKILLPVFLAIAVVLGINALYLMDNRNADHNIDNFTNPDYLYGRIMITNIGSSHGMFAFNYNDLSMELSSRGYCAANFALPSQTYDYDLAILKQYRSCMDDGGCVLIPVSYFSFSDETVNDAERQAMTVRYYSILDKELIPDYDWFLDLTAHRVPALTAGSKLLEVIPDLIEQYHSDGYMTFKGILGSVGTLKAYAAENEEAQNREEELEAAGQMRYERHFAGKTEFFREDRTRQLKELIEYCKRENLTPILITTPFYHTYTDPVGEEWIGEFEKYVKAIAEEENVGYYNYGTDIRFSNTPEYFADADHLGTDGALYFMKIIENEIPELKSVLQNILQ